MSYETLRNGFIIRFANGVGVSCAFGSVNYCENRYDKRVDSMESKSCFDGEVQVFYGEWVSGEGCVYLTAECALDVFSIDYGRGAAACSEPLPCMAADDFLRVLIWAQGYHMKT